MADIDVAPTPKGQNSWIWPLVAVVAVLGLMLWLANRTNELATAVPMEADTAAVDTVADVATIELAALAAAPDTFIGQPVTVAGAPVAAKLGDRAFWAEIPSANPFLVVTAPAVANIDLIAVGNAVNITGTVGAVSDSVVSQWIEEGSLPEASRAEAEFATHYLLAEQISQ